MRFSLFEHPDGVELGSGDHVVYDLARDEAQLGAARVDGHALVWRMGGDAAGASLTVEVELDPAAEGWIVRCDRVDFPPGGVAHRHVHPGPGIRRLLAGRLRVEGPHGAVQVYGPGGTWFEGAGYPVLATASVHENTAFVRVMLLPAEWEGKRTIRYVDAADDARPRLQRATVFLDRRITPP